ncbi:Protein ANTI-SILENCING 1 [Bienertia sinuspersici]
MSFTWGIRIANNQPDSDSKSYKSFNYQGVQYSLFDCVYMYREGAKETDVGKLTKLWETKTGGKRGKVVWFFRPVDIFHYLRDYEPSWNELFMASGQGKGLSNIVPLEAIIGKCNVVCTSKDSRNNVPSGSVLGKANYFFSHTFDVGDLRISDVFPDYIDSVKVHP